MRSVLVTAILLLSILNSLSSRTIPGSPFLAGEMKGGYSDSDRVEANFILDIIQNRNSNETDTAVFAATGKGFSMGYNTMKPLKELRWRNSRPGYGGSSAIGIDIHDNIWMTTAVDSFISDLGVFLSTGTGVHFSSDSGKTWNSFRQPGITPVQGLTYDIACDSLGGVWMASFGQSIQKLDSIGGEWRTLTPDNREWDPFNYMNQRLFSIHFTDSGNLWAGTAQGVNLCTEYNVPDGDRKWRQFTFSNGLTGNFVTALGSKYCETEGREYVFAASWVAESAAENNGVSYTYNNGQTWNRALEGEKVYNFAFRDGDVYACGDKGLWKSSDNGRYWENYVINAWSERKRDYVNIDKVYSFEYQNGIMFAGTGYGIAASENDGRDWEIIEAYISSDDSRMKTYAYPNPFSPQKFGDVRLQFGLKKSSPVSCTVYNFAMEKVRKVTESKPFGAGEHYITWDGKDPYGKTVSNGVYFYVISSEEGDVWNKIIIFE